MKLAFATRARATRVFLPVALAGVLSSSEPDPVFTTRLEIVGVNSKRSVAIGQSSQRLLHRGATKRQITLEGASR